MHSVSCTFVNEEDSESTGTPTSLFVGRGGERKRRDDIPLQLCNGRWRMHHPLNNHNKNQAELLKALARKEKLHNFSLWNLIKS